MIRILGASLLALVVTGCSSPPPRLPVPSPKEHADALALIAQLQQAGAMTRYSCEANEAFVTPAGWQAANADAKFAMMAMFTAACNGGAMSIIDSQSGKRLARFGASGYAVD